MVARTIYFRSIIFLLLITSCKTRSDLQISTISSYTEVYKNKTITTISAPTLENKKPNSIEISSTSTTDPIQKTQISIQTRVAKTQTQQIYLTQEALELIISPLNVDQIDKRTCFSFEPEDIQTFAISPKVDLIAVGLSYNSVIFLNKFPDLEFAKSIIGTQKLTNVIKRITISPAGDVIASGTYGGKINLWQLSNGKLINTLSGHKMEITGITFNPDGKILASGSFDHTIGLWNVSDGSLIQLLRGHKSFIQALAFSPNDNILASGGGGQSDSTIRLWDVENYKLLSVLENHIGGVYSISFSPDGNMIASAGADSVIRIWDVKNKKIINFLKGHKKGIISVHFSPDGKLLVSSGNDGKLRIWNVNSGELIKTIDSQSEWVFSDFSLDGRYIVTGGGGGLLCSWGL
ncbi:MAG: WD40 repeat domain-containing protein [Anaerolineales bacterium]